MAENNKKIAYVTRDIERALGMWPNDEYSIVSNKTPYTEKALDRSKGNANAPQNNIRLIDGPSILDTADLLGNEETREFISKRKAAVMVFKNTTRIEEICRQNNWELLNPKAELAEKYENKITQVEWLGDLKKYLPLHSISITKEIKWKNEPFVIQWAHGHTGDGTILVNSEVELKNIKEKFPERLARVTTYIEGPSFTVNVVVAPNTILIGNISYQITGLPPFTDNPFSTVGNDWSLTHNIVNNSEISYIETIAREIGEKMRRDGWKGLFGIDIIRDDESKQIFLIEINARQPASTTFESFLQKQMHTETGLDDSISNVTMKEITTFEAHLLALQDMPINQSLIKINDSAQIVQRITKKIRNIPENAYKSLESAGYQIIHYSNTEMNSDLLRIQSMKGIMETHGELNNEGREISAILFSNQPNTK